MIFEEFEKVQAAVNTSASAVLKRHRGFVEWDDLQSEGWVWILSHSDDMDQLAELDERLAAWRLRRKLWSAMDRYARKERAARGGYQAEDEQFYGRRKIAALLPKVLRGEYEPDKRGSEGKSVADPATGGDHLAECLDVAQAWEHAPLSERERLVLELTHIDGLPQEQIAQVVGLESQSSVSRIASAALGRMVDWLGGSEPRE